MSKAATAKPAGEKKPVGGAKAPKPLDVGKFKDNPVRGASRILQLRSPESVKPVLTSPDFEAGIRKLASDAAAKPTAAVALSKFVLHSQFSDAAGAALKAVYTSLEPSKFAWPEPSKFESKHRQTAADALARLRPSWGLSWLAKALVGTQARYAKQRHFFASRLILASGGLMDAADALGRDLLLDEKIVDLVTKADADAGAKLREDAAKMEKQPQPQGQPQGEPPPRKPDVPPDHETIMREAAWSDADEALGRALRDMGFMARSFEQLEAAVDGEAVERADHAKGASDIVLQWVRQAARQRGIKSLNSIGERVQFDPVFHDLDDEASPGDYVRIVTPPIVRGDGEQPSVLLRGEVELD